MLDAVIVGFGPTGATMANLLGQRGWKVAVVERSAEIYDKPRAITADHESMRVFQQIGLAEEISETTSPHPGTKFLGVDGAVIKKFYPAEPPNLLGWEPSFMFTQPVVEGVLRAGLHRFAGVRVELLQEVVGITQGAGHACVETRDSLTGATTVLDARYVLGCDGAASTVRRLMNGTFDDLKFDEQWLVVDAIVDDEADFPSRCIQYCRPSRPGTYIVGPGKLRRWEIKLLAGEGVADYASVPSIHEAVRQFTDVDRLEILRHAVYRFHAVVADRWRYGRVFLLGDAAHQMPPFLGQGMGAGIRDTVNLAWKLDAVHRMGAAPDLLDTYEDERKPHVRTIVDHAKDFGRIIGELDPAAAVERDRRLSRELHDGSAETVRQNFTPGLGAGLIATGVSGAPLPGAGQLFPQPQVETRAGQRTLLDRVLPTGFAAVTFADTDWIDACLLSESVLFNGPRIDVRATFENSVPASGRVVVADPGGLLLTWAGQLSATVAVVRPDRYVYGTASTLTEFQRLSQQLNDHFLGLSPVSAASA
jgi:3-(3-hydroxy-phenyl)propionate hydroxylase